MIDLYATERHFVDHLAAVWDALPEEARGDFMVHRSLKDRAIERGIEPGEGDIARPVLVASWGDYKRARDAGRFRIAYMEHGAGQSYDGDRFSLRHPGYSGGIGHEAAGLYLVPNEYSAGKWRAAYPSASVQVIGCPKLDSLPSRRDDGVERVVAISFHWPCGVVSETGTAFSTYRPALAALRARFPNLIGHGHPRALDAGPWLRQAYQRVNIPVVEDFAEVCRQADVYVCDNSSSIFEFAATGRPVVVLNHRGYRKDVDHGGRFWDWATVGLQVDEPAALCDTIDAALEDTPEQQSERERILDLVYPVRSGAAYRAADALMAWAGIELAVAA